MSMVDLLKGHVATDVKSRGVDYALQQLVDIEDDTDKFLSATVCGSSYYDVNLLIEKRDVLASCTCPYVDDRGEICKHIWAVVLKCQRGKFAKNVERLQLSNFLIDPESLDDDDDDDDDDRYYSVWEPKPPKKKAKSAPKLKTPPPPPLPAWQTTLAALQTKLQTPTDTRRLPAEQQPAYVLDRRESERVDTLVLDVMVQERKRNGEWSKPKKQGLSKQDAARMADPLDRRILALLTGADRHSDYQYYSSEYSREYRHRLSGALLGTLLPMIAATERVYFRREVKGTELEPLVFDPVPWELTIPVEASGAYKGWQIAAAAKREGESRLMESFELAVPGIAVWNGRFAPFDDRGSFAWVAALKKQGKISIPHKQAGDFVAQLLQMPTLPRLELPEELRYEEVAVAPRPHLIVKTFRQSEYHGPDERLLTGELSFQYGDGLVASRTPGHGVYKRETKKFYLRDHEFEAAALAELFTHGFQKQWSSNGQVPVLDAKKLSKVTFELLALGWHVEADGKLFRKAGEFKLEVSSGVDWFDLNATADFEGQSVSLPRLLEALRKGEKTVVLDDGHLGMLPDEWLEKYGLFARLGTVEGDSVRFRNTQVGLLDALLASRPEVSFDKQFAKARDQLRKFDGISAVDPPKSFVGELREYQREGLGWLLFLRKFGFGGCLADDMGLGKTVQVLAMLAGKRKGPALVVVPKSLVFNWKSEAAKFAPKLKVLDHTGTQRDRTGTNFRDFDIVLTTYGILRMDATVFTEVQFDTCILDESQAAKNANTETAKAVRLIRADYRFALSGTPIENHLGELWTLFEFLNPGMLGQASLFAGTGGGRNPPTETRELLAKALRPYILRRTKGQVAKDLPEKTEQIVYCDLEPEQRKLYDELRDHYRAKLLAKIDTDGLNKSKIMVLEALLRLRQAACHPGLIDKTRGREDCAKLDLLLPQLREIAEEGHKTLVFSQFTSFLDIVRKKLDQEGIDYEYLDGKTNDRQARVDRFQTDPERKVFLISLKAGGVGLNLTAAEYVYILDPWWNPAAEAQAIDRSHRIGQTKAVFAYRLIARNTVEEKVLELQESKRALANAILGGEGSLITELKREDLELLLS